MMLDCCYEENMVIVETAATLLYKISHIAKCRQMLLANGTMTVMVRYSSGCLCTQCARLLHLPAGVP